MTYCKNNCLQILNYTSCKTNNTRVTCEFATANMHFAPTQEVCYNLQHTKMVSHHFDVVTSTRVFGPACKLYKQNLLIIQAKFINFKNII